MPLANLGNVVLNYRIDGADGLPLLLLSNGLGLDLTMWDPQIAALSRDLRVLRCDTRGHGASSMPAGPCTMADLGRDVLGLLDHAGVDRMHFCGFSLGGMVGQWLGIHAPQRLHKLVLAHTAARIGPPSMWNERIATVNTNGMQAISGAAMERWFTRDFNVRESAVVDALKEVFERNSPAGYVQCCAAIRDVDFTDTIHRIGMSTLVISGTRDNATTLADGQAIAQRIAGSQFVEIDAAHLSNIEKPAEFTKVLLGFLRGRDA
ncbi:MAG: 3-oxoadipate enol-lactonase [Betaproteobacteria bacterium]